MNKFERQLLVRITTALLTIGASTQLLAQVDVEGIWILDGPGTESEIRLTAEGERRRSAYDLLVDDPSLYCTPASSSRVWANPNAPIRIEQGEGRILISYELFDLRREIPLGDASALSSQPSTRNLNGTYFPEMGTSFATYADDRLVIESRNHANGFIRTSRGIPQSANTVAIEELRVEDEVLRITHTYIDETLFEVPLVLEYFFRRADELSLAVYNCTDANYDWFDELNNN